MTARRVAAVLVALALSGAMAGRAMAVTPGYTAALSQFMCVSCHEPLELVDSPQALSEQQYMRSLLAKGLDMAQVKAGMVAQYGPAVLAQPPASGFNLTVYVLPPAVFLGGVALLLFTLPKWRARSRRAAALALPRAEPLAGADAQRLDAELERFI
jgi:cytochrome c-type biogenesis protein CcmH/NrfF